MAQSKVITINGLTTRVWTYKPEHGYGCAECCNGDRCDEDCTAKYRRPNCPHCKGRGWVKEIPASDYAALQAKCARYEAALNAIIGRNMPVPNKSDMIKIVREALGLDEGGRIANKALSAGVGEKEVALSCMVCESKFMGPEPKMCCNGSDCGCLGQPIDPIVCSEECYNHLTGNQKEDQQ